MKYAKITLFNLNQIKPQFLFPLQVFPFHPSRCVFTLRTAVFTHHSDETIPPGTQTRQLPPRPFHQHNQPFYKDLASKRVGLPTLLPSWLKLWSQTHKTAFLCGSERMGSPALVVWLSPPADICRCVFFGADSILRWCLCPKSLKFLMNSELYYPRGMR